MTPVERLLAIEDIKRLKARYFRFLDTKQWDDLASLFAPDAAISGINAREGSAPEMPPFHFPSPRAFAEAMCQSLGPAITVHHGHMPEIDIRSPTEATGIWAMDDLLHHAVAGPYYKTLHGWGHYHETYRKSDETGWRISNLRLSRLCIDLTR